MKRRLLRLSLLALCLSATNAYARDDKLLLPIADVLASAEAQAKLDPEVKLHFAGQPALRVKESLGEGTGNRKTNAFNKSDEESCRWAALSALLALQETAKRHGANAVINIKSYYKKNEFASATEYECHAGAFVGGVALRGTYARVAK